MNDWLTPIEFRIHIALEACRGRTLSREDIGRAIWPGDTLTRQMLRAIDVHVTRLRRKLGDEAIVTVYGEGYTAGTPGRVLGLRKPRSDRKRLVVPADVSQAAWAAVEQAGVAS